MAFKRKEDLARFFFQKEGRDVKEKKKRKGERERESKSKSTINQGHKERSQADSKDRILTCPSSSEEAASRWKLLGLYKSLFLVYQGLVMPVVGSDVTCS